jgi:hypothetical protein
LKQNDAFSLEKFEKYMNFQSSLTQGKVKMQINVRKKNVISISTFEFEHVNFCFLSPFFFAIREVDWNDWDRFHKIHR